MSKAYPRKKEQDVLTAFNFKINTPVYYSFPVSKRKTKSLTP